MRNLKKLFYGISVCIFLICIAILGVASNPEWSSKLSKALYGDDKEKEIEEEMAEGESGEEMLEEEVVPRNTPMVYETAVPEQGDSQEAGEEVAEYKPQTIDVKTVIPAKAPVYAYSVPTSEALTIPENMTGLNGYAEISATLSEVEQSEAERLWNELDEGDTGDLLVFDQRFYPYYYMLDDMEKELYRQIYANAYAMIPSFKPCVEIFSTNLGRVVEAVFNDNPVLFWVDISYGCKFGADGRVVEVSLQFNEVAGKPEQSMQKFEECVEEILSVARTLESDYEKEKFVHDKLASKISYVTDAPMNQTAYSAIVNGKTVCAGYARAFQYIMQQLGIPCFYCRGYSGENHAWNIIELYGDYYNVDLTWDDAEQNNYDYFNKTDKDLSRTHIRKGASIKLPACNGTLYGNLENGAQEGETEEYSPGLDLYYNKLCERIDNSGRGEYTYSDVLDLAVWKELEEKYTNGNSTFREDYLIRSLHKVGAEYCILSFSAEKITDNAYEVTCSMIVD